MTSKSEDEQSLFEKDAFLSIVDREIVERVREFCVPPLDSMVLTHFHTKGKRLRPKIVFALGQVFGVSRSHCVNWAVCCEILHNATLIHDDLQDGDTMRRGAPSIWSKFGMAQAINVGDFLLLLAPRALLSENLDSHLSRQMLELFTTMSLRIVNGQSLELELNEMKGASQLEEIYINCISLKTAALFSGVAEGVAILAGQPKVEQRQLAVLFEELGLIFQIQDDILDLWGDKKRDEIGCDIKEGKVSYLIVQHLVRHPQDFDLVRSILQRPRDETSEKDVAFLKALFFEKRTYGVILNQLNQRVQKLRIDPIVLENKKLNNFIDKIILDIMNPISHLYPVCEIPSFQREIELK